MSNDNEALAPVDQPAGALIDAALDSTVLTDGWKASSLIPELASAVPAETPSASVANADKKGEAVNHTSVSPELSSLVETLGGVQGLRQLVGISSHQNPSELISQLLTPEQRQQIVWSLIDDPATQQILLTDPDVKRAISDAYFQGNDLDEISEAVAESFTPAPDFEARQTAKAEAYNEITRQTQLAIFHDAALEVARSYNIDLNNPDNEVAVRAWEKEVRAFAWSNRDLIDKAIKDRVAERNFAATVETSRLANKFCAHMVGLLDHLQHNHQSLNQPTEKKSAQKKTENQKSEPLDALALDEYLFAQRFAEEFTREREARGI